MKKLLTIVAASVALAAIAADTDVGALITASNIEDVAAVENLTGANAGKATVTIKNNSGTANAVTVYNAATVDSALSGKASTGDVTALQTRASALETATNNLTTAVAAAQSTAASAYVNATNYTAQGYLPISGGSVSSLGIKQNGTLTVDGIQMRRDGSSLFISYGTGMAWIPFVDDRSGALAYISDIPSSWPYTAITNAPWLTSFTESDPTVPSWAKASSKPSYNFSEIGSKPTTISGYGITDAKIESGTITLGSASITPLTSYTETDPTALKPSQLKVNGTAMTTSSAAVELGGYYIKTVDGKPHLFLRN